jgi:hypothetical protein
VHLGYPLAIGSDPQRVLVVGAGYVGLTSFASGHLPLVRPSPDGGCRKGSMDRRDMASENSGWIVRIEAWVVGKKASDADR